MDRDSGGRFVGREPEDRFFESIVYSPDGCWMWTGTMCQGYGRFYVGDKLHMAHRWAYNHFIGPISDGLVCDHIICDTPGCVNPHHLQIVDNQTNIKRSQKWSGNKTHCKNGHRLSGDNLRTRKRKDGREYRECRQCACDALSRRQGRIRERHGLSEWTYYKRKRQNAGL